MNNPRPTPETDAVEYRLMKDAIEHNQSREALALKLGGLARKLERERDELREQYESQLTVLKATLQAVVVEGKISWETFKPINNALTKL